jgi:hypothetical protein
MNMAAEQSQAPLDALAEVTISPAEPGSTNGHTAAGPEAPPDRRRAVADALHLLHEPGCVFEVRILETQGDGVVSGYFNDPASAADAVATLNGKVPAIYVSLNRLPPAILARANNRLKPHAKNTTADAEVVQRRWLLVDADEQSLTGISSSREEHAAALARIQQIAETLTAEGWPEPVCADSGNGGHALFPIDMPNDEPTRLLVERLLKSLAVRFDDPPEAQPRITLDTTVSNAARLTKLYGTAVRKGDALPDRPHRWSGIRSIPAWTTGTARPAVKAEQMQAHIAAYPSAADASGKGRQGKAGSTPEQARTYLEGHRVRIAEGKPGNQGQTILVLAQCIFDASHTGTSAAVQEWPSGARSYRCFHQSCAGKTWGDVRDVLEGPGWRAKSGPKQGTAASPPPKRVMVLQPLAEVEAQRCEYLMEGYLALGELNVLAGAGGAGKTSAAMDITVRVAGNLGMPGDAHSDLTGPEGVLYLTTENHPAKVMRPRMEATALALAGGDATRTHKILRRIFVQRGVVTWPDGTPTTEGVAVAPEDAETLVLPRDLEAVRDAIRRQHVRLLVIDPVISFTAADVDVLHPAELRHFLDPLALLAQEEDIAVLGLLHFTKAVGTAIIMRISLSRQMTDTARIVSVVLEDPRDDFTGTRWLTQAKTNLGFTPPAYSFTVQAAPHPTFADEQTAVVEWGKELRTGNADKVERDLAREAEAARSRAADPFNTAALGHKPRTKEATNYLGKKLLELRDQGDLVVTGSELDGWQKAGGFSNETWVKAREHLGIKPAPTGFQGGWQQDLAGLEWLEHIPPSASGLLGNRDPITFSPYPGLRGTP